MWARPDAKKTSLWLSVDLNTELTMIYRGNIMEGEDERCRDVLL